MRKTLLFAAAVLALAACSSLETPTKENGAIDLSKLVFNIQVKNADATKAVKTAWENGDVVYAFFEDNTTQYVKMTYDGTSWGYEDKSGGTSFDGLTLTASGKKVSAVYMPAFVCSEAPSYATDKWTFGSVNGYFQTAEGVEYTVTSTADVTTLSATLSLTAPLGISQVFIPSSAYSAPASGNEHVLTATHIAPFTFSGIAPGGAATFGTDTYGFPLTAYSGTIGSDAGYYFWGILDAAGTLDFDFQLVERKADKKYAISSKSKSVTGKTVGSSFAAELTGLTDNGKFVSLGYAGGPLWATGNLNKAATRIEDPLLAGQYFMYGYTSSYNKSNSAYTGNEEPVDTSHDAAYTTVNTWRTPTLAQFQALINGANTSSTWVTNWTAIGSTKGGRLVTSKVNGISLFFAAAGMYNNSTTVSYAGERGRYWSSTRSSNTEANYLAFDGSNWSTGAYNRNLGFPIRPVKNI